MDSDETARTGRGHLERYAVLDLPPERDLQALVDLAAEICDVPTAAINLISASSQHQIATSGMDRSVCTRADSMCAAVVADPNLVVVPDASFDPRFERNPFVTGDIGSVRFYASAPLVTPDGVPLGRLCVFDEEPRELSTVQEQALGSLAGRVMDVLELRFRSGQLEDSLRELTQVRDELKRSNEQLAYFADQVSHDLRNPLAAILANAELLSGEPVVREDATARQLVEEIELAGHRMDALIGSVLAAARPGGRLSLRETDLAQVVRLVLVDLTPLLQRSSAEIVVDDLPTVRADHDQMYSVLLNLLTNAVKFARPGIRALVHVRAVRGDGRWCVEVTDNGMGVPPHLRHEAFALFGRLHPQVPGTGVGLATTKRIVAAHGGEIGMRTPPAGVGTTLWFELPD